jgi:hypothetical protein
VHRSGRSRGRDGLNTLCSGTKRNPRSCLSHALQQNLTLNHVSLNQILLEVGRGSSVGIATAYVLDGPGIESPVGSRFSALVQTSPEAHPASCTMGTGSFPGVRYSRGVTLTPHPLLVPRSKIESSYTSTVPKGLRGL